MTLASVVSVFAARKVSTSCRVSNPEGLPFTCTTAAPAFSSARTARETGSPRPTVGSGGDIWPPTGSDGPARPATRAASRSRSTTDPTTSAAITGGSSLTTGSWDTSYSRSSAMAAPTFSSG